jgi:predicted DNA-binding transcriptional regulator AlpA
MVNNGIEGCIRVHKVQRLLTAAELEALTGVPRSTWWALAKSGRVPHFRVGRRLGGVRFEPDEALQALRRPARNDQETC